MYMRALKSVATLMVVFWDRWGWWSRLRCELKSLCARRFIWDILANNWIHYELKPFDDRAEFGSFPSGSPLERSLTNFPSWPPASYIELQLTFWHPAHQHNIYIQSGNWPFLVSDIFTLPVKFTFCWLTTSKSIPGSSCSGAWPKMIISFSQLSEMFPQFHFLAKMNFGATQPDQQMRYSYSKIDNLMIKHEAVQLWLGLKWKPLHGIQIR